MAVKAHPVHFTLEEYVAFERGSNRKHEFLDGTVYAMAGGTREHALYAMSVGRLIGNALRGKPCAVHSSDLRVRVLDTALETYPDVSVVCGRAEMHPVDQNAVTNPIVLVEVTSPSTEEWDRGEKLEHYKRIASLREIVLVGHREKLVEVVRREADGTWTRHEARGGSAVKLVSLDCELAVDEVYRDPLTS